MQLKLYDRSNVEWETHCAQNNIKGLNFCALKFVSSHGSKNL